uniref:Uncharacterized protein n=1 Tax=Aegilops tauschii subsp. strangulata TaxID=200361 RepID=A0A453K2Q2_AEGTS
NRIWAEKPPRLKGKLPTNSSRVATPRSHRSLSPAPTHGPGPAPRLGAPEAS